MLNIKRSLIMPALVFALIYACDFIFPSLMNPYLQAMVIYCGINIILAVSLNLVNGFTGQFSIGHAGFMAAGAYLSAWLTMTFPGWAGPFTEINFFCNTIAGGLLAAAAGYIVGLPSLRLKGDYLAIVTLGFGEIIRVVLLNVEAVGGARGMYGIPKSVGFFGTMAWVFITCLTVVRLMKSTHGRAFLSVREDEIAAEAMGIDTTKYKVKAFVISSFFAGIAGSIFAHYLSYLNPSSFGFMKSIDVVVMVVLGGMGSISGSVVAAIIITLLPEALRPLQEITRIDFRMVIYSLTLIILMLTKPQGLFGSLEISDLWKKYVRRST
ncbi:MAG: branched-chain amino acid ABC transporter permease [Oligoflexia bacterium]|nr:branched-chain amino acid ABC transporter permease [Oligoflexia bacterium]